jgi:hypothetical protein
MVSKNVLFDEVDLSGPCLVLLVLKGTDDYKGHAVCLIRGLVFDASTETSVVFNRSNLDLCCGDGEVFNFHECLIELACINNKNTSA